MTQDLGEFDLRAVYHALGANLYAGLELFEKAFLSAERDYRLEDTSRLLEVLKDPTLLDERISPWRVYYEARKQMLEWQPNLAEETLKNLPDRIGSENELLVPYLLVLRAKICAAKEEWLSSQTHLAHLFRMRTGSVPAELLLEAYLTRAQTAFDQAQSLGGWAEPWEGRGGQVLRWFLRLTLLPVYLLLFLGLALAKCSAFIRAALRHGADYSNWPVFRHYLDTHLALRQAEKLMKLTPEEQVPGIFGGLRLELLNKLGLYSAIEKTCRSQLENPENPLTDHQRARLKLRLAEAQLEMGQAADLAEIGRLIEEAAAAFRETHDSYAATQTQILQGRWKLASGKETQALEEWKRVMEELARDKKTGGGSRFSLLSSEILTQCYKLREGLQSEQERTILAAILQTAGRQIFFARMPEALFRWLQYLAWFIPPLFAVGNSVFNAAVIQTSSPEDFRALVRLIFSPQGLVYFLLGIVGGMGFNSLLGLVGLGLSTLTPVTRLKGYQLSQDSFQVLHWSGEVEQDVPWEAVREMIWIKRGLFARPTGMLSRAVLRTQQGWLSIPGTVAWPEELTRGILTHAHIQRSDLRLKWYGGIPALAAFLLAPAAFFFVDAALTPYFTVPQQAWLALIAITLTFLLNTIYLAAVIRHYVHSALRTGAGRAAWIAIGGAALLLLVGAPLARKWIFPLAGYGVAAGSAFIWALIEVYNRMRDKKKIPGWTIRAAQAFLGLASLGLVGFTWGPVTANIQTYAYSIAIIKAADDPNADAGQIDLYFDRLRQAGKAAIAFDPGYYQGHYAIAWAEFHTADYEASVRSYTQAIASLEKKDIFPPYYYCRALAYSAGGNRENADQDYHHYLEIRPEGEFPACYFVFKNFTGQFPLP